VNRESGIGNRFVALAPVVVPMADVGVGVGGELVRVILSLLGIIVMILVAGWFTRRMQARSRPGGRRIRCIEAMAVGARDRVLLLDADGKRLLVGMGPGGMRTLHVYDGTPDEPAPVPAVPAATLPMPAFGELLARWKRSS
jgi:flagellar protein FliO/FliZ